MSEKKQTVFIGREMEVDRQDLPSNPGEVMPYIRQGSLVSSDIVSSDHAPGEYEASFAASSAASETPPTPQEDASEHGLGRVQPRPKPKVTRKSEDASTQGSVRRSNRVTKTRTAPQTRSTPTAGQTHHAKKAQKKVVSKPKLTSKIGGREWEVEAVVGSRIDADTYEHFYEVKWKGYSSKENSWEPKAQLSNCLEAIRAYEEKGKGKA